jgi:hypothetical protein
VGAGVLLEATLGEYGWLPLIENQLLYILEVLKVAEERVQGIGVDPPVPALCQSQGAGVPCGAGVADRHEELPEEVTDEGNLAE